ncbi:hypothetical protein [Paracoccus siganidrum]|uniref:DUF3168 domain-containing protein n=1 Tax=Paracoccus siganidrum TaxID=1276757 RepID=A0A419A3R1_9RHOB|nr:hypothetical protein [Paracoccus siganidrum]RJL08414.1 hypothetical protein D3P05_16220 [Paracoccus siganidrum]RMC39324.1 hypothetical protein C9E82_04930 [Paracoccus siganidrum]
MADHGLQLMQAIDAVLRAQVPLAGGWHATRLGTPIYPVGYVDLTSSTPMRGEGFYAEQHRGVVSLWSRKRVNNLAHPAEAFRLCEQAHRLLGAAVLSSADLVVQQFQCGAMTPRNPDGVTWGRSFTFSAITHEVQNG